MLGSSAEAVRQVVGETARWVFEGIELSGRMTRICAASEPDVWSVSQWLGVRMAPGEGGEDSKGVGGTNVNQVTDLTFEIAGMEPKFAAAGDLSEHTADSTVHVSNEDRTRWDAAAAVPAAPASHVGDATHIQEEGRKLVIKGTQGNNLLVVRGNETNVSVTGSQLSFNVPRLTMMSDSPVLYRYDMETGTSDVWFAGVSDETSLAPLGLTVPGTYVGAPSLPLCLRGSVLSFNGTEIDVSALAQLLARKDELLAPLAEG